MRRLRKLLLFALFAASPLFAHVGSPDIFVQGNAGPYRLFVTVRVPQVIPGIAQVEVRSESNDVAQIGLTPMQLTGPGSRYPPTPDIAQRSSTDPQFFTGSLWLMEFGSLQVRIHANGFRGAGEMAVPVPAIAQRTLPMRRPLGLFLFALMLLLSGALLSIVAAAVREGNLPPGAVLPASNIRRSRAALLIAAAVVVGILFVGDHWWKSDADRYARNIYNPPGLSAELLPDGQLVLRQSTIVRIASGNPRVPATMIDFNQLLLDHDHLMHFFMIRTPQMDSFWHLHPQRTSSGEFVLPLPPIPAGRYQLFADIVLNSGFPVTLIGNFDVPNDGGKAPLTGDDSEIIAKPLDASTRPSLVSVLPDGGRMVWDRNDSPMKAGVPFIFRFRVLDPSGKPASDLEPYMGMPAHAEVIRSDGSVFAHIHPDGSVNMAALEIAESGLVGTMPGMNMPGMNMSGSPKNVSNDKIGSEISFPYGFPKSGLYRVFVQIKRSGQVQTAVFDVSIQ